MVHSTQDGFLTHSDCVNFRTGYCILIYSALSTFRKPDISNVKKQERIVTMTMILLPIALVTGAYT
jgi:hypothetical protein